MKLRNSIYLVAAGIGMLGLSSCNDFLDTLPDNRAELSKPDLLLAALTDGYPDANYAVMCEMSSDNIVDNHAKDANGISYDNLPAFDPIDDQIFAWEDADMNSTQDSPTSLWSGYYHGVAVANHVLQAIEEFRADGLYTEGEDAEKVDAAYGEALVMRAFCHFNLVNLFAMQYGKTSESDMGIPYVTEPEDEVSPHYERESVASVYRKIEADLEEGLKYITDEHYSQPKFHFNMDAANAFAARFYLYKRDYQKVLDYANAVLGSNPAGMMRTYWSKAFTSLDADCADYFSSGSVNNFLLIPTTSNMLLHMYISSTGTRYALNREAAQGSLLGNGPSWRDFNFMPCYSNLYVNGAQEYGLRPAYMSPFFQYTDKVAGIGYYKAMVAEFTAEDVLLMRAEAKIFMNDIPGAVADLSVWSESRNNNLSGYEMDPLDDAAITSYYNEASITGKSNDAIPYNIPALHIDEICDAVNGVTVTEAMKPYLWCVLHFRRMENICNGRRWFDIKRFGIEVTHVTGHRDAANTSDVLVWSDKRRAFQVPIEAISAGLEPTDRGTIMEVTSSMDIPANLVLSNGSSDNKQ